MNINESPLKPQISQFKVIRDRVDQAYADYISDTTEENRDIYRACTEDYLYAQLTLLINLRHHVSDGFIKLEHGYVVWDKDWPHRVHIVNDLGRDRCDRCHGEKMILALGYYGDVWVECKECNSTGKEFVSLVFKTKSKAS